MTTRAAQRPLATSAKSPALLTWEQFQRRYLMREDSFKYEWVNGRVEKMPRSMDKTQLYILINLMRFLAHLKASGLQIIGELVSEGDTFFAGNHRRPDIAYYNDAQIQAARHNEDVHPDFVIEVISKHDQLEKVARKMEDYRAAGVAVVWHIFSQFKQVHVYRGKRMQICTGDDLCSAEPVIPGFVLPVGEIFK